MNLVQHISELRLGDAVFRVLDDLITNVGVVSEFDPNRGLLIQWRAAIPLTLDGDDVTKRPIEAAFYIDEHNQEWPKIRKLTDEEQIIHTLAGHIP